MKTKSPVFNKQKTKSAKHIYPTQNFSHKQNKKTPNKKRNKSKNGPNDIAKFKRKKHKSVN